MAIMAMTTRSSINVNARFKLMILVELAVVFLFVFMAEALLIDQHNATRFRINRILFS